MLTCDGRGKLQRFARRLSAAALGIGCVASAVHAGPPDGFIDAAVVSNWNQAVGVVFDAAGRGYVWEKSGHVWLVENGVKSAEPLIDIEEEVGDWRDLGLLGFALDPNFQSNGYIYLLYDVDYHHLKYFGTAQYDPFKNEYFHDTIARVTRYTCNASDGFRSVDPNSRHVLIGESMSTGFPITHQSHSIGTLMFGADGTLLVGCGDGANYSENPDVGGFRDGSSNTALTDGIIRPDEDIGAFRAQYVDSLSGKVLRIDPATGDGVPSNPFYDAGNPRAARSRVWAMGFRNPFRWCIRPGTGSANPAQADPGTLFIGDVGWGLWETIKVTHAGGANFGWPLYEGLETNQPYVDASPFNLAAPNPLAGGACPAFFRFRDLLAPDTLGPASWPNPCNPAQQIPASVHRMKHTRPALDYYHLPWGPSRSPSYAGNEPSTISMGTPGSPIAGPSFGGNCITGGVFYTGSSFPPEYHNAYFFAEFDLQKMKVASVNSADQFTSIEPFNDAAGAVVCFAQSPHDDAIYYIRYDEFGNSQLRRITYGTDGPPVAVASVTPQFGPAPLEVQFSSAGSEDPEGLPLRFEWNFGDGSPPSHEANPTHTYINGEDITGEGILIAHVYELDPPGPSGMSNTNPEIVRDFDFPPTGSGNPQREFSTDHYGQQGDFDWFGYYFVQPRVISRMYFQEGIHFPSGGWWDELKVDIVVNGDTWQNVPVYSINPPYAGAAAPNFSGYVIDIPPVLTNGVRISGKPGGSDKFISLGELRVIAAADAYPTRHDVTLTVTDAVDQSVSEQAIVVTNDTPPSVDITDPPEGFRWNPGATFTQHLRADIDDTEDGPSGLACVWQAILKHNDHTHPDPEDPNCESEAPIAPHGSDCGLYHWEFVLTVTDSQGLSTRVIREMFPNCCAADINSDREVDLVDFFAFFNGWDAQTAAADVTSDHIIDLEDFFAFFNSFDQGCP